MSMPLVNAMNVSAQVPDISEQEQIQKLQEWENQIMQWDEEEAQMQMQQNASGLSNSNSGSSSERVPTNNADPRAQSLGAQNVAALPDTGNDRTTQAEGDITMLAWAVLMTLVTSIGSLVVGRKYAHGEEK